MIKSYVSTPPPNALRFVYPCPLHVAATPTQRKCTKTMTPNDKNSNYMIMRCGIDRPDLHNDVFKRSKSLDRTRFRKLGFLTPKKPEPRCTLKEVQRSTPQRRFSFVLSTRNFPPTKRNSVVNLNLSLQHESSGRRNLFRKLSCKLKIKRKKSKEENTDQEISLKSMIAKGFCPTLYNVLRHTAAAQLFRKFLEREHSSENLDFWTDVEIYKKKQELAVALQIDETYIGKSAPREVNLSSSTVKWTKMNLEEGKSPVFDRAQTEIYDMMLRDSFVRFKELSILDK